MTFGGKALPTIAEADNSLMEIDREEIKTYKEMGKNILAAGDNTNMGNTASRQKRQVPAQVVTCFSIL